MTAIKTLGELKQSGYNSKTIKDEMRTNLIERLKNKQRTFEGIFGFDDTVLPDLERAILSRHNILMLGLRGQAKTRIARLMLNLLDEYVPVVEGSEINDDPMQPLSRFAIDLIKEKGDQTPITWLHRNDRYTEKLATPDVTVADLIGDSDPIKAANLRLPYSDERVIHFGLIPRSHRCIFVINELPDLQPRIQVALFNILQEGDIQIRGFKLRLPLDIQFVFTANPEDYTNRGSIVTPLKDRIESQILTHYPKTTQISKAITQQEARLHQDIKNSIEVPELAKDLIEQIAFEARNSEFIDKKSGVSARLTTSAYENLLSTAQRRMLINNEQTGSVRVSDFFGILPAITGKIELVYEGEQEGSTLVARSLFKKAIKTLFGVYFPNPEKIKKQSKTKSKTETAPAAQVPNPYQLVLDWFADNNQIDLMNDASQGEFNSELQMVTGLEEIVTRYQPKMMKPNERIFLMEFVLNGLAEHSLISKNQVETQTVFKDLMSSMFDFSKDNTDEDVF